MIVPSEKEYAALCEEFEAIPISLEIPADTETPVTVFSRFAGREYSFLLESVEGGERLGRYSFIGMDPALVFESSGGINRVEGPGSSEVSRGNPFDVIRDLTKRWRMPQLRDMPRFYGGLVGYLGYGMARHLESLPMPAGYRREVPDCILVIPGLLLIMDHVRHTIKITAMARKIQENAAAYRDAVNRINAAAALLAAPPVHAADGGARQVMPVSNLSRGEYEEIVAKARNYIMEGDILQVVVSRRIELPWDEDTFSVYRMLRRRSPSPYMYYLNFGSLTLAGSSPEMLVRVEGGVIETRPIAGTRPRGATPQEDSRYEEELLADEKERAEHLMLVDLGRNDLGRVSRPGTVKVSQFMEVERYSHVMHLVSSVRGELAEGLEGLDGLKSSFPAGTVSGAPKVRAMEIIDELEPSARGPYAGCVGYIGFSGSLDMAITIRTVLFHKGRASVQVGAGIVADSVPLREFVETKNKAAALLCALGAEGDFDAVDN